MGKTIASWVALIGLLLIAGCAAAGNGPDNGRNSGFYGGVFGGGGEGGGGEGGGNGM